MSENEKLVDADYKWGVDYGNDLLKDINQLAHAKGTGTIYRDVLQRSYIAISRLRASPLADAVREALEPLAKIKLWSDTYPDAKRDFLLDRRRDSVTVADVLRARAVLRGEHDRS
jgi:hypothetical protein